MLTPFTKKPGDVLDIDVEFVKWLGDGDTVRQATATIEGGTAAIDRVYPYADAGVVKVWVSGGANGENNTVKVTTKTRLGRTKVVNFVLKIRECH